MSLTPRICPYPRHCLERISGEQLKLASMSGFNRWADPISEVAADMARRFGLGSANVELHSVRCVRVEDLRRFFPGKWRFAVMADPLNQRKGFLALDPLLATRLGSRLVPQLPVSQAWQGSLPGLDGAVAWVLAYGMEECSALFEPINSWRFMGIMDSWSEMGKCCLSEDAFVSTWIRIHVGWDRAFAVWLEPGSSVRNRSDNYDSAQVMQAPHIEALTLVFRHCLGSSQLLCGEVLGLKPGDVVILSTRTDAQQSILRVGNMSLKGIVAAGQMTIESIEVEQGGLVMEHPLQLAEGRGTSIGPEELARLPINLVGELGRIEMTVGDVARLRVGDVVSLPGAILDPVEVRAGGRLFARGELVDVDGRRGIRLSELIGPRGDAHEGTT